VFALANMLNLLANKFAGLCAWRFTFAGISARPFDGFFLRHKNRYFRAAARAVFPLP
jgi:hypothetical protein